MPAIQVAVGGEHACALLEGGDVWCWGANRFGQLGRDGGTDVSPIPLRVVALSDVTLIVAGQYHNCALAAGGQVKCWGIDATGASDGIDPLPGTIVDVSIPGSQVVGMSAGAAHACALGRGGEVSCWGRILIQGSADNPTPVPVPGLGAGSGVTAIASGTGAACALVQGAARCWGQNLSGQLGTGDFVDRPLPAIPLGLESGVATIALGTLFGCATMTGGQVKCWGATGEGQAGQVSGAPIPMPSHFPALDSLVQQFALGQKRGCAIDGARTLRCWGSNERFALGAPHLPPFRSRPDPARSLEAPVTALAVGSTTCARSVSKGWRCVGGNEVGQHADGTQVTRPGAYSPALPGTVLAMLFPQRSASCALDAHAGVWCWGMNWAGNVGDGTTQPRLTPIRIAALGAGPRDYSASDTHACAVDDRGGTWCWGSNLEGLLGDGTTASRYDPVPVGGPAVDAAQVASGRVHTCRLSTAGSVSCWGAGYFGQLGNGGSNGSLLPSDVVGITDGAVQIAVGDFHSCAVTAQGNLYCWGSNVFSQLGVAIGETTSTPTLVPRLAGAWRRVTAGRQHTCAEVEDGRVACWGWNSTGQAGVASGEIIGTPTLVHLPAPAISLAAGLMHTCALLADGVPWCWGTNVFGELGAGVAGHTPIPQEVRLALFADQFEG